MCKATLYDLLSSTYRHVYVVLVTGTDSELMSNTTTVINTHYIAGHSTQQVFVNCLQDELADHQFAIDYVSYNYIYNI